MRFFEDRELTDEAKEYIKQYFLQKVKGGKKYFVSDDEGDELVITETSLTENNFEQFNRIVNGVWFGWFISSAKVRNEADLEKCLDKYLGVVPKQSK